MADTAFQLTPAQPTEVQETFAAQVLLQAQQAKARSQARPLLSVLTQRIPIGLKRQLKEAAQRHRVSQASILVESLRLTLPPLLVGEHSIPAVCLDEEY